MNNSYVANCKPWVKRHCITNKGVSVPFSFLPDIDKCAVKIVDDAIKNMMKHAKY